MSTSAVVFPDLGLALQAPFRLRAAAALLTYNASHFTDADFEPFVDFIQTVESISRWTATLERSEHAENMDRLHLHVYIEFHKAPDWTSLRPLAWRQVLPNCSPCRARGAKWRESVDQGHFYCWAAKAPRLPSLVGKSLRRRRRT